MNVESLGGGWQSSCLLLMACEGELPGLDAVVFADTQGEMPATYDYLNFLKGEARRAGIEFIVATAGNLSGEVRARAGRGNQPSLPVRVLDEDGVLQRVNSYTCSFDFKRRIVTRETRKLCGGRGAWKKANVVQWIGYTVDEISRLKDADECRCGHKRAATVSKKTEKLRGHLRGVCRECVCTSFDPWQTNRWPLVERQMRRTDTRKWLVDHGYPTPPRSACYFCPNRGNSHWRDLKSNHPVEWKAAVSLDEFVRTGLNGMKGQAFLHQSGVPLADADLRTSEQLTSDLTGQDPLFAAEVDTDCDAGVCFT